MKEILKNSFILSISEVLLKLSKLISFVVIANVYSVEYLGIFNYIVSFLLVFFIIGELGINTYITTEQSKLRNFPNPNIMAIGIFKILIVFVMMLLSFCMYFLLGNENEIIMLFVALLIFSDTILTMIYSFYRAVDKYKYEFYFKIVQSTIYCTISFLVYYWYEINFIYFIATISLCNLFLSLYSLYILTNFKFYFINSILYIKKNFLNNFKHILPIFLTTVFTTLYFRIDIIMIESLIGIQSVGYYSVAYKLIEGAMVIPLMLGVIFLSKLSTQKRDMKKDLLLHFILGLIIFIAFYYTVSIIIDILFADTYQPAVKIAQILSFSIIIMSINTYLFNYFIANKNTYINVKITLIMLLLNLILNLIFIPIYGMSAAAYTTVGTELVGMIALLYYVKRYYVSSQL